MVPTPDFYVHKAQRAFSNAYGDDPNVLAVEALMTGKLRVTLADPGQGAFPVIVDGVPIEFVPAPQSERVDLP